MHPSRPLRLRFAAAPRRLSFGVRFQMKVLGTLAVTILLTGCGALTGAATSEAVSLKHAGTITFGRPSSENGSTRIPLTFSGGEWNQESARVFCGVKAGRYEYEIHFSAMTCLVTKGYKPPEAEIALEGLRPGKYQLIYQNPDETSVRLGEIEI